MPNAARALIKQTLNPQYSTYRFKTWVSLKAIRFMQCDRGIQEFCAKRQLVRLFGIFVNQDRVCWQHQPPKCSLTIWLSENHALWYIRIIKTNEMHYFSNLFWYRNLHILDRLTVHHLESSTVYTAIGTCHTAYAHSLLADNQLPVKPPDYFWDPPNLLSNGYQWCFPWY
jgi:hypothetical protein